MTSRPAARPLPAWLPIPRRSRPPLLATHVDLRPAPVAATGGNAGSAVRDAMQRVRDAAAVVADPAAADEAAGALEQALAELDGAVAGLLKATAQEVTRARRHGHEAPMLDVRVSALRRPRRGGPADG